MPTSRNVEHFQQGEKTSASKLEGLRKGAAKRIRGLLGRESSTSAGFTQTDTSIRETLEILNDTGITIPAFSLFAVKKSGTLNYPWGPPVRTDAFSFEAGLDYVTNYDFGMADGQAYTCQTVGHLPVLIRYNANDGLPKIGHPIGPLEDGSVSIKRCGFVVIAEPDTVNERVWIVKSNDQMVRVEILTGTIDINCRGDGYVIGAVPCGNQQSNAVPGRVEDPNVVSPSGSEFVLREILNLSDHVLIANELVYAEPTLGLGYVVREKSPATIVFTMLTDRTREIVGGLTIGYADVSITGKVGTAGEPVGSTVKAVFADERWLESVKGCKGIADYVYDPAKATLMGHPTPWFWIVKEVQGLVQGFWAITDEDRTAGAPQQDVRVIVPVVQNVGHANDDYPVDDWGGQPTGQQQQQCTGNAVWTYQGAGVWILTTPCGTGCTSLQNPNGGSFAPPPFIGQTFSSPCVSSGPPSGRTLKVRYVAGSFPHMLKGALCYCTLDNDITNTTDNTTMIHYVVQSDQMAKQLDTTLAAKMCGTDPEVGAIAARTFWPFSQVPVPAPTITNPHNHYGMPGDKIVAEWSEHYQRWEVVEVDKHVLTFSRITDQTDQNGCRTIAWIDQNFAGEICEQASAGGSLALKLDTVTGITTFGFDDGDSGSGSGVQCNPKLTIGTRTVQVWTACGQATTGTLEIPLTQESVVVDLNMDGCPTWATSVVIVFGQCGSDAQHAATCDECPEGSGSGQ